jgi:hypothetical protein
MGIAHRVPIWLLLVTHTWILYVNAPAWNQTLGRYISMPCSFYRLQASPACVNVSKCVLNLTSISSGILIPLGLEGNSGNDIKRTNDVCAKFNSSLITEEAESSKGAVGD